MEQPRGKFIVFEGIDGSGLSTQVALLHKWFVVHGLSALATKEPSDGPVGRLLQQVLSKPPRHSEVGDPSREGPPDDEHTLALLFTADRMDHLSQVILPALQEGCHVVCDRYYLSTFAYQSTQVDLAWLRQLNAYALRPDLTLFLDVPAEECRQRMDRGRAQVERYENLEQLLAVRARFLELIPQLLAEGERIRCIDGAQTIEAVHQQAAALASQLLAGDV